MEDKLKCKIPDAGDCDGGDGDGDGDGDDGDGGGDNNWKKRVDGMHAVWEIYFIL